MRYSFGESLRRLRIAAGLSQQQLAAKVNVDRSTVAKWENGHRLPDYAMMDRLSECLHADMASLMRQVEKDDGKPVVILVDDERIILTGGMPVIQEVISNASVYGFTKPSEAIAFAQKNRVDLAFLDIEMGRVSGLDVCRELIKLNSRVNVIYLTAYREYAFDAWATGACGFLLKPLDASDVRRGLLWLRYPVRGITP